MKRSYLYSHSLWSNKQRKQIFKLMLIFLLLGNGAWIQQHHTLHAYATGVSPTAVTVYGQAGNFTTATTGITSTTLNAPRDVIEDSSGNLYVSEFNNNRVLYYAAGSTTATRVYGQGGSFTSSISSTSTTGLSGPQGLALDSSGDLYIADNNNSRVLYYAAGSTTATRVYGQGGSFTTSTVNNGGISATSLNQPNNIALDSSGNLYVSDSNNSRVLYYTAGSTTATRVYGQAGSFTTNTANNGGGSATSLSHPTGITVDSSGNLYIADSYNNRVLYYAAGSTTATRVYGQAGSFTTGTANNGGISATSLNIPSGVAVDSGGNLYIADNSNSRVLYFPSGNTTATRVYGQAGSFTTNTANNGGVSATSLNAPYDINVDSSGNIYVADFSNNRVLKFQTALSMTTQPPASSSASVAFNTVATLIDVGSGATFSDFAGTVSATIKSGTGTSGAVLGGTTSVVASSGTSSFPTLSINLSGSGYILTLSSPGVSAANTTTIAITAALGLQAITVYGQVGSFTTTGGFNTASGLYIPRKSTFDNSGDLYIADTSHHRVLYYPVGSTTATRVYGQAGSFTTGTVNNGGISATSLNHPFDVALDSSNNLYVADTGNNRVLYYPSGTTTATRVYGQNSSFTTNSINNTNGTANTISATSLDNPQGIALDSSGNLYVSDNVNNRVLYYPSGTTTATRVYGQNGSFTTNSINNTNGTANTISATSLNNPQGIALDNANNLYVVDSNNNRVLYYPASSTTAMRAYGQAGSFTTGTVNNTSGTSNNVSANSMNHPYGIVIDSSGNIYIADSTNNRMLVFQTALSMTTQPAASTTAGSSFGAGATLIDVGSGTVFSDFSGIVSAAIKAGTGTTGAALGNTTSNAAGNGIVTFSSFTINKSGTGYILTLSSPGVGSVDTSTFTITASTLVGYWPFNEGSGTSTTDWSPNGYTGTITGASWTIGQVNSALSFNGTSNYVSMGTPSALQFGTGSFTAMAWFKTTSTGGLSRLFSQGIGSFNGGFGIDLNAPCTGCVAIVLGGNGTGATNLVAGTSTAYNDGNWHQATMVINRTTNTAQLYIDDVAQSLSSSYCGTAAGTTINITSCTSLTATTTDPFVVGVYTGASGTFQYFNGSVDEVRLYNTALTSQQIQTQYANDTNTLTGYWPLDENTATFANDYSPNGNTGAITGGTWSSSGQVNGALGFNGSSDNVLVGTQDTLQFGVSSFTTMAWFNTSSTTANHRIISTGNENATNGYYLSVNRGSCIGCVGAGVGAGGTSSQALLYGTTTSGFNDGKWHLEAMVIDQTAKTAQLYVDGVAQPVSTVSGTCGTASGTSVNISACTSLNATGVNPFTIGYSTYEPFPGTLDEIRTYDRALTSSQIANQYTLDTNPTPGGYWPFDENTGTTAHDSSTNNDTGTITGATWTAGKINSGLSFNGTSNYVSMGTPSALQLGTSSFTIISWFKTSSTAGFQRLVSMGDYIYTPGYLLSVGPSSTACVGCVGGSIGGGGTLANSLLFYSTAAFNDNTWHQAAMVINQVTNTAQIYVDGVARTVATQSGSCGTASGTIVNITACTSLNASGTTPFTVGSYSGTNEFFTGNLDEPRIYGSPLSSQEILNRYTSDVNALSEYATNVAFSGTVGGTATYTLPIAISYPLTPAPGWSLTVTSTTLTNGTNTLPTTASKITAVANTCTSTCTPTTMTNTISGFPMTLPAGTTAPTAVKFFGTAAGTGTGTYTITPTISVTIPYVAKTGAYTSTVTLTAASGP